MKIKRLFFFLIILLIAIFVSSYFLYFSKKNNLTFIQNNTVKIIKKDEIIKNSSNPKWLFLKNTNIKENILSGFFIEKDKIITANHWLNWDNISYKIITKNQETLNWKVLKIEEKNDLAFLKTDTAISDFNKIKIWKKPKTQDIVFSFYYDENHNPVLKQWTILKIENWNIYSSIGFQEWESGSALLNKNYEIIWINLEVDIKNNIWISRIINDL